MGREGSRIQLLERATVDAVYILQERREASHEAVYENNGPRRMDEAVLTEAGLEFLLNAAKHLERSFSKLVESLMGPERGEQCRVCGGVRLGGFLGREEARKLIEEQRARIDELRERRAQQDEYNRRIGEAIGPNRERRPTGEPAKSDAWEIRRLRASASQIDRIAKFLMEEFGGPDRDESAIEMAMRLLGEMKAGK